MSYDTSDQQKQTEDNGSVPVMRMLMPHIWADGEPGAEERQAGQSQGLSWLFCVKAEIWTAAAAMGRETARRRFLASARSATS